MTDATGETDTGHDSRLLPDAGFGQKPPQPPRSRQLRPALVAAVGILAVGVLTATLINVESVLNMQFPNVRSLEVLAYAGPAFGAGLRMSLGTVTPLAIGAFLSFWLVVPLAPQMRLIAVLWRCVVAVVVATLLVAVTTAIRIISGNQLALFPDAGGDVDPRLYVLIAVGILNATWVAVSTNFTLIVAAGLGIWGWLRGRQAPLLPVPVR